MTMKMRHVYILWLLLGCGLCGGCGGFFEEKSQNLFYVTDLSDLDELLVGEVYISTTGFPYTTSSASTLVNLIRQTDRYFPWIHLLDDDAEEFAAGEESDATRNWVRRNTLAAHRWQAMPFLDKDGLPMTDYNWPSTYRRIAVVNSILEQLGDMGADEPEEALRVEGEARFMRAFYYFWLVNLYAQPYAAATAEEEPGVPLKLSPDVEDNGFARASVAEVYRQIREDLERAAVCLRGRAPERPVRASAEAAHLLLSRVALYSEDYEGAIAHADSVIGSGRFSLLDLNGWEDGTSFTREDSPETVFTQGGYIMGMIHTDDYVTTSRNSPRANAYTSSPDLMRTYDSRDLRRDVFFLAPHFDKSKWRCLKSRSETAIISDYMLMRHAEAYLNKAEAQAIAGDEAGAKATLQELRARRFPAGQAPDIAATGEELVNFVRDERRRELCFEGHRWFDLRRYAVNSRYPFSKEIRHVAYEFQAGGEYAAVGEYVLRPYAEDRAAYVFPIPEDEIVINHGSLAQNAARPDREMTRY